MATSIVSHTVTVLHDPSLKGRAIAKALNEAGYEVESSIPDPVRDAPSRSEWRGRGPDTRSNIFPEAFGRWVRVEKALDEETKKKRHESHCELCRAQQAGDDGSLSGFSDQGMADHPSVVVDSLSSQPDSVSRASISIMGMSCSSCIGKIDAALEEKPWVTSVNVALITQSASVEFKGEEADAARLIEIIDDLGYEVSLEHVTKLPTKADPSPRAASDVWKALYSIEGITCSSCVGTVTEALRNLSWVQNAEVNLVTNSAMVVLKGKSHRDLVPTAIENAGYGASLNDLVPVSTEAKVHSERRMLSIKIDGMHCNYCPSRVADALSQFGGRVTVGQSATIEDPIATISYIPEAPEFTIRAILGAISAADQEFEPCVYHSPTLEKRARQMHARV